MQIEVLFKTDEIAIRNHELIGNTSLPIYVLYNKEQIGEIYSLKVKANQLYGTIKTDNKYSELINNCFVVPVVNTYGRIIAVNVEGKDII